MDNYDVALILDNRIKQGTAENFENTGIAIINPANICNNTDRIYLMSMHFVSMWKQLVQIGVNPDRLVYPFFIKPYFQSDAVIDEYVDSIVFSNDYVTITEKNGNVTSLSDETEWYNWLRCLYRRANPIISTISSMSPVPFTEQFVTERGTPVDRYYIERFLQEHRNLIKGDVLEIEDNLYTKKFGISGEFRSIVMDYSSKAPYIDFNADLESGDGIRENIADCFIITQTLMYIFDVKSAAANIGRLLKKNGYALITCSGLSQNSVRCMDDYGSYFNFNPAVFRRMFEDENSLDVLETGSYGNVKTVSAHIAGLCCEDLTESDFSYNDKHYPLIVYAVVKKNG